MANFEFIRLETKPTARLSYRFWPHTSPVNPLLVVFLNDLILPQVSWSRVISRTREIRGEDNMPALLTYDRFGSGQSEDRDPQDEAAPDPGHGHDCMDVAKDLRQLIMQIAREKMGISRLDSLPIILVGGTIGGCIARLYAQEYPGSVAGILFLDCLIADTDLVSLFPDPDKAGFNPKSIPADITVNDLRIARQGMMQLFHPTVGSKEGLTRMNLRDLLPHSDKPPLKGPDNRGPFITILCHDPEACAEEAYQLLKRPRRVNIEYLSPAWQVYHEGLLKTTEKQRAEGPIIVPGAGHMMQKYKPDFVAEILDELLSKII